MLELRNKSQYLNNQNEEISHGTKNMSIIKDVNREPEILSQESPKDSKDDNKPEEWPKRRSGRLKFKQHG